MIERQPDPDAARADEIVNRPAVEYKDVPRKMFISDTRNASIAAAAVRAFRFDVDCDGYLVYVVADSANPDDLLLVSVYGAPGSETDDILTPGHGIMILNEGNTVYVANTGANPHTVVVKAFKNWTPAYI